MGKGGEFRSVLCNLGWHPCVVPALPLRGRAMLGSAKAAKWSQGGL